MSKVDEKTLDRLRRANDTLYTIRQNKKEIERLDDSIVIKYVICTHFLLGISSFLYLIVKLLADNPYIRNGFEKKDLPVIFIAVGVGICLSAVIRIHNRRIDKINENNEHLRNINWSDLAIIPDRFRFYEATDFVVKALERDKVKNLKEAYTLFEREWQFVNTDYKEEIIRESLQPQLSEKNVTDIKKMFLLHLGMAE
ncbi:MAG: hypothetical protein HUJ70_13165 [Pseudobutyrivibrio sp.]|nr:hypothetical protein [Pseudobutyrivibrio sp.]